MPASTQDNKTSSIHTDGTWGDGTWGQVPCPRHRNVNKRDTGN